MFTVNDFLDYCIEETLLTVEIYSLDENKVVWTGEPWKMPYKYLCAELGSWDVPSKAYHITLNIE